jgi:hypothetical protein
MSPFRSMTFWILSGIDIPDDENLLLQPRVEDGVLVLELVLDIFLTGLKSGEFPGPLITSKGCSLRKAMPFFASYWGLYSGGTWWSHGSPRITGGGP